MASNAYNRLSVGNSIGNNNTSGYTGYGAHQNTHVGSHGTHNAHSGATNTHGNNNEVTFPNNVTPEDYLGKFIQSVAFTHFFSIF